MSKSDIELIEAGFLKHVSMISNFFDRSSGVVMGIFDQKGDEKYVNYGLKSLVKGKPENVRTVRCFANPTYDELLENKSDGLIFRGVLTVSANGESVSLKAEIYRETDEIFLLAFYDIEDLLLSNKVVFDLNAELSDVNKNLTKERVLLEQNRKYDKRPPDRSGSLLSRYPAQFKTLKSDYEKLIEECLVSLAFKNENLDYEKIGKLARTIGELGGGPRDVIDMHISAVKGKGVFNSEKRMLSVILESRILIIELMGYLVDYYRSNA